jgi:hypothetical protein
VRAEDSDNKCYAAVRISREWPLLASCPRTRASRPRCRDSTVQEILDSPPRLKSAGLTFFRWGDVFRITRAEYRSDGFGDKSQLGYLARRHRFKLNFRVADWFGSVNVR